MIIRDATKKDLLACKKLLNIPEFEFPNEGYPDIPYLKDYLEKDFFLVAEEENKIIIISETLSDYSVNVQIRDYGPGIKEEIKEKLFKPFITTRAKGFGIGLAVSKSIIDSHQGKIRAQNNPDGGATFSIELKIWTNEK